jgi:hypothetical protein
VVKNLKNGSSPLFRSENLFCHSERSEESETLDNQRFRFFTSFRMTNSMEFPKAIPENE